jgi:hypothetical protein
MFQTTPGLLPHIRKKYSLADVFSEIHKLACSGQLAQTAKIDFSSPFGDRSQKRS